MYGVSVVELGGYDHFWYLGTWCTWCLATGWWLHCFCGGFWLLPGWSILVVPIAGCNFFCIGYWNAGVFWLRLLAAGRCTLKLGTGYLVEFLVLELSTKL